MFVGYTNYGNQQLLLNNYYISGLQSINIETDFVQSPVNIAGIGALRTINSKNIIPNITLEQIVTNYDVILNNLLTGNSMLAGYFQHNQNVLSFNSGVFKSYNLSCRVNELVRSSTTFEVYGLFDYVANTGQFGNYSGTSSGVQIPDYSSISIGLNEALVDRVIGFNLSLTVENNPVYSIGAQFPHLTKLHFPIECKVSFDIEVDQSQLYAVSNAICLQYHQNVSVLINTKCNGLNINTISLSGASLNSQKYRGQIGLNAIITYEYIKYFNQLPIFALDPALLNSDLGRYLIQGETCICPKPPVIGAYYIT